MTVVYDLLLDKIAFLGRGALLLMGQVGRMGLFAWESLWRGLTPPYFPRLFLRQCLEIGYFSLPVIGLTALFTGMVLALQSYSGFSRFNAESAIATVVVLSVTRELGPVLAGLMVAGRIGAAIAAEIGSMRISEQIDAMTTLSTDPFKYLVFPRILAGVIVLPLLVLVADSIGVMGGYWVGLYKLGFNPSIYLKQTAMYLKMSDVTSGLIKASVFGFWIAFMGCFYGFHARGGANGVGNAATQAVVGASILILLSNYLLTAILFV